MKHYDDKGNELSKNAADIIKFNSVGSLVIDEDLIANIASILRKRKVLIYNVLTLNGKDRSDAISKYESKNQELVNLLMIQ